MKRFLLILAVSALCACGKGKEAPEPLKEQLPEGTLAVVGGAPVTQADFDEAAKGLDKDFQDFLKTPAGKEDFLDFLIKEKMMQKAAEANNIENSPRFKEAMETLLADQAAAARQMHDYLMRTMLYEKLQKDGIISIKDEEIRAYYNKYPYQITVAHILMSDPQKAAAVMREVTNVRSLDTFGEYARKYSTDPVTNKNRGVMEPFIPGEYLPEIEIPAANTAAFQVQGFIKTSYGFHIIMKVKEESISFNNAKERIRDILEKQKMDAYLNTLKERYSVEVMNNEVK